MKSLLPIALSFLLVTGCANGNGSVTITNPLQPVQQFTVNDLQTAVNIAKAQSDTEGAQCWSYLLAQVQASPGTGGGLIAPTGLASTFEAGRSVVKGVNNILSSAQRVAFETNCGPMILNAMGDVTALGTVIGAHIVLPALPVLPVVPGS